jgi:hypothetical protein
VDEAGGTREHRHACGAAGAWAAGVACAAGVAVWGACAAGVAVWGACAAGVAAIEPAGIGGVA